MYEPNRALVIPPVNKTDWHLVFLQCSYCYLVMKERESLQLVSCDCVLSHSLSGTDCNTYYPQGSLICCSFPDLSRRLRCLGGTSRVKSGFTRIQHVCSLYQRVHIMYMCRERNLIENHNIKLLDIAKQINKLVKIKGK